MKLKSHRKDIAVLCASMIFFGVAFYNKSYSQEAERLSIEQPPIILAPDNPVQ